MKKLIAFSHGLMLMAMGNCRMTNAWWSWLIVASMLPKSSPKQRLSAIISEISVALSFSMKNKQETLDEGTFSALDAFGYVQIEPFNQWVSQLSNNIKNMRNRHQRNQIANIWQQDILGKLSEEEAMQLLSDEIDITKLKAS